MIYFHGGGYTVGSVDEFENGLRIVAEESGVQVYGVEYELAPEWLFSKQLDEYAAMADWLHGEGGKARGVNPERVMGGVDSAGGNMTPAVSLRLRDEGKRPLSAHVLLYPEASLPFDTKAASENSGLYLECKSMGLKPFERMTYGTIGGGIFSFADHYLPRGTPPVRPYVSPGMQPKDSLENVPPAAVLHVWI